MAKFKNGLVKEYKEQEQFKAEQVKLKEKHNIKDDKVVVVEKNNMIKFTVNVLIRILKCAATIALLCLAAVGLAALVYPKPRADMLFIINDILSQIKTSFGL